MVLNVPHFQSKFSFKTGMKRFGDAIALGFAHEGRRSFDAQTLDLVLEIAGHVIGAMIVTSLSPRATPGAMEPKHRLNPCRTGSSASKRLGERAA